MKKTLLKVINVKIMTFAKYLKSIQMIKLLAE